MRRVWAGITQLRVAATLSRGVVDRLVRQPISWHQRRPDGDLVARAGVDTDAAIDVLAPMPFATSDVLMIVLSSVWLLVTDLVLGARRGRRVPAADRRSTSSTSARSTGTSTPPRTSSGELSAAVHESFDGVQLVKAFGAEQRETERLVEIAGRLRDARVSAVVAAGHVRVAARRAARRSPTSLLVVVGAIRVQSGDDDRRRARRLHLPVHAARVPAAPDRLRLRPSCRTRCRAGTGSARCSTSRSSPIRRRHRDRAADGSGIVLDDVRSRSRRRPRRAARRRPAACRRGASSPSSGRPGAGKTTLVELVAGLIGPDRRTSCRDATAPGRSCSRSRSCSAARSATTSRWAPTPATTRCGRRCAWRKRERFVADLPDGLDTVVGERGVEPQRRAAPTDRAGPGAGAPPGAAAARRHHLGARPGHRGGRCSPTSAARSPARPC